MTEENQLVEGFNVEYTYLKIAHGELFRFYKLSKTK